MAAPERKVEYCASSTEYIAAHIAGREACKPFIISLRLRTGRTELKSALVASSHICERTRAAISTAVLLFPRSIPSSIGKKSVQRCGHSRSEMDAMRDTQFLPDH